MSSTLSFEKKDSCTVCFQKSIREDNKINCFKCEKIICKACLTASIHVLSTDSSPCCPMCKQEFTTEFLNNLFTKNFRKQTLRKHKIQRLIEKEKLLFPETQLVIEKENAYCEYIKLHVMHTEILKKLSPTEISILDVEFIENINELRKKMQILKNKIQQLNIVSPTRINEKCHNCQHGYLSPESKCQLCDYTTCSKCLVSSSPSETSNHTCKEADIASKNAIDEITKSCPHCFTKVEKSQGCNQMWCTACNHAFNWETGQKINGPIHNPHYSEFLKQRELAVIENCLEDNVWPWQFRYLVVKFINAHVQNPLTKNLEDNLMNMNSFMIRRCTNITSFREYSPTLYENLRKMKLRGKINDEQWAKALMRKETKRERNYRIKQLDELMISIARDLIIELSHNDPVTIKEFESTTLNELNCLRLYYNEELKNILDDFGCKRKEVNEIWEIS